MRVWNLKYLDSQQEETTKITGTHRCFDPTTCHQEICVLIGTVDQRQLSWYYHWGGTNENAYACTCNYCNAIKVWSLLRSWERRGLRQDVNVFLDDAQTLVSKYWQAGTVKNRENVSCELRVCRRDKSKTDRQIRKGTGLKLQVYSVSLEDEW